MDDRLPPNADFDPEALIRMMAKNGHNRLMGTQYHGHGPGWCQLALPYAARLVGDAASGILASGPIFTLMDMATSLSIWLKTGIFQPQATMDLRVDYLRPAEPGQTVIGHGECYHVTRRVAFVRGHAHDGDPERPLAHVAGTYFFTAS
jgi:uncharacterized protein (TIGR00369 family)